MRTPPLLRFWGSTSSGRLGGSGEGQPLPQGPPKDPGWVLPMEKRPCRHQGHKERRGRDQKAEPETSSKGDSEIDRQTDRARQWGKVGELQGKIRRQSRSHLPGLLGPPGSEGQPRPGQHPAPGVGPSHVPATPCPAARRSGPCQVGVSVTARQGSPEAHTWWGGGLEPAFLSPAPEAELPGPLQEGRGSLGWEAASREAGAGVRQGQRLAGNTGPPLGNKRKSKWNSAGTF